MSRSSTILFVVLCALALPIASCTGQQQTPAPEIAEQAPPPPAPAESPAAIAPAPPPAAPSRPAPPVPEDRPAARAAPPRPSTINVTIPEGTSVVVSIDEPLSSESAAVGQSVTASLNHPLIVGDRVVFPAGSRVEGQVTGVKPAKKGFKDTGGALAIAFERISAPNGRSAKIVAGFTKVAEGSGKKKGAIIGGSAAGLALLGKVLGKDPKGAALVGGAIGTAVAGSTKGKEAVLENGEQVTMALEAAVRTSIKR